jgi:hypothetical protein
MAQGTQGAAEKIIPHRLGACEQDQATRHAGLLGLGKLCTGRPPHAQANSQ